MWIRSVLATLAVLTLMGSTTLAQSPDATISEEALKVLGETVSEYVSKDQAVGAELLVIQHGEELFHQSFGFADREGERAWQNETICNIRSMTKPITAAAAQLLIDRGKLKLDAPVAKYLSSFDNEESKSITVRQVLTHRSGFPLTNLTSVDQYSSLAEQVAAAGKTGPEFEPDSKFWYSDVGTDVVGALVETISGQRLHEFVSQEILEPLGMTNSFYGIDASDKRFPTIASLYFKDPKGWKRFWKPDDKPFYPFAWGSQTIYSTPSDYARFLTMFMNVGRVGDRQLLSPAAVDRMLAPVSRMKMMGSDAEFPSGFQGLQVFYGQMMVTYRSSADPNNKPIVIGHSGSDGTYAWAWPKQELLVLFFTQSRGTLVGGELESAVDRLLIRGDVAGFRQEMQAKKTSETSLTQYEGIYWDEDAETAYYAIIVENDDLVIERPGRFRAVASPQPGEGKFGLQGGIVKIEFDTSTKPASTMTLTTPTRSELQKRHRHDPKLPSFENTLAKVIKAHAIDQLEKAGVVRLSGTIKMTAQNREGKIRQWFDTRRSRIEVDLGATTITVITNDDKAAASTPGSPIQPLEGVAQRQAVLGHPAIQFGGWQKGYSQFEILKEVVLEENRHLMVRATTPDMPGATIMVNLKNGLISGDQRVEFLPGAGFVGLEVSYSDYREVAGMNLPFHIESEYPHPLLGKTIIQYDAHEIGIDKSDLFDLPKE